MSQVAQFILLVTTAYALTSGVYQPLAGRGSIIVAYFVFDALQLSLSCCRSEKSLSTAGFAARRGCGCLLISQESEELVLRKLWALRLRRRHEVEVIAGCRDQRQNYKSSQIHRITTLLKYRCCDTAWVFCARTADRTVDFNIPLAAGIRARSMSLTAIS